MKRSVLTDARGVILGLAVGPANRHDVTLGLPTLDNIPVHRWQPRPYHRQHLCADKAYQSAEFRRRLLRRHYIPHIKSRGEEVQQRRTRPHAKARRWVNERTQSWLNRFQRLLIRREKKEANYTAILHLAAAWIAFRAAGILG